MLFRSVCTPDHRFQVFDGTYEQAKNLIGAKLLTATGTETVVAMDYNQALADVYCLTVPNVSNFVLDNGIISHNCDALRYLCKERLIDATFEQPPEVFNKGKIKLQAYIQSVRAAANRARI